MKKRIILIISSFIISIALLFACSKAKEEGKKKMEKASKKKQDAFSEYVETGVGYIDQSKELNKEFEKRNKEMEEQLLKAKDN